METTMKKTTSPIVREYKIGDITYIVKAVIKDGAKEDAVTKVRRLIQNDLRVKKLQIILNPPNDGERDPWYNINNLFVRLPE